MKRRTEHTGMNLDQIYKTVEPDLYKCTQCECTWLEQIEVAQYISTITTVMGQPLPPREQLSFILLKCPKCGELMEPRTQTNQQGALSERYNKFLDEMEAPMVKKGGAFGEKL